MRVLCSHVGGRGNNYSLGTQNMVVTVRRLTSNRIEVAYIGVVYDVGEILNSLRYWSM